jgi:hypothetical protein
MTILINCSCEADVTGVLLFTAPGLGLGSLIADELRNDGIQDLLRSHLAFRTMSIGRSEGRCSREHQ